jgi:hypothetical protein
MNTQQEKRYEKIFNEPLYQIDFKQIDNKTIFIISGSTKNVYEVSLQNKKFECNCPDAKTWSRKHHVVCKHICFVIFRVTKVFVNENNKIYFGKDTKLPSLFFDIHKLSDLEQDYIDTFLSKKQFGTDVISETLKMKYLERIHNHSCSIFSQSTKEIDSKDECPICYDLLLCEDKLLSCPECKNHVHSKCMEKWLEYNKSCVYCRSEIWTKLNEKNNKNYVNLNY